MAQGGSGESGGDEEDGGEGAGGEGDGGEDGCGETVPPVANGGEVRIRVQSSEFVLVKNDKLTRKALT